MGSRSLIGSSRRYDKVCRGVVKLTARPNEGFTDADAGSADIVDPHLPSGL